jgi:hypothetical protein
MLRLNIWRPELAGLVPRNEDDALAFSVYRSNILQSFCLASKTQIRAENRHQPEIRGKLFRGKDFQLREGAKIVAEGLVTSMLELENRRSGLLEPLRPLASDL